MPSGFRYDVFISHSSKDKPVVRALVDRLRNDGLKVWFDETEIKPGDSIPAKIDEGLEDSNVLLLCMSANAFGSDWAQLESQTFRFRDPINKERRFIPLRLDNVPIKGSLAQFAYIDWRTDYDGQRYGKLLEACRHPESWRSHENYAQNIGDQKSSFSHCEADREHRFTKWECEIVSSVADHGWIYVVQTDAYGEYVSTGNRRFFDAADASIQAKYLDGFESLFAKGIVRSEAANAYRLTGRGFELRKNLRSHADQKDRGPVSATPPSIEKDGWDGDYLRWRRDTIRNVFAEFEGIHAFFFEVCVDYMTIAEILHSRLSATEEIRNKYYRYVRTIGAHLQKMHLLEGRLALTGAEGAVQSMQQYRLQATEVNNMLRLQLPCKNKGEVECVANELFRRKDRLYDELAKALKRP